VIQMNDSFQKSERPFSTETIIHEFLEPSNYVEDGSFSLFARKVVVKVNPLTFPGSGRKAPHTIHC